MESFESLIRRWDGLGVLVRHDRETGTWIFVALHDDTLGAPTGGTRMAVYPEPVNAMRDAMRLAEAMTLKWAVLGLDAGGGKCVLAVPRPLEGEIRRGLLRRYGRLLNRLRGAFGTGRDLGTTDEDMWTIAEVSSHVHGVRVAGRSIVDAGPYTARGVLSSIRAALIALDGRPDLAGRSVAVQGVGDVGAPLARLLAAAGARLILADVDELRAARLAREIGATTVAPDEVYDANVDVFAPCAMGGILDASTVARLRCRAVVGSANNQLSTDEDAARLHARGIVWAPDFVANGGAALALGLLHRGTTDETEIARRVDGIGETLAAIFREAGERHESPSIAARRLAARRLG